MTVTKQSDNVFLVDGTVVSVASSGLGYSFTVDAPDDRTAIAALDAVTEFLWNQDQEEDQDQ